MSEYDIQLPNGESYKISYTRDLTDDELKGIVGSYMSGTPLPADYLNPKPQPKPKAMGTGNLRQFETKLDAHTVIKNFEGYRDKPYWDVNAYRAGYGSDTYTDTNGKVHRVTPQSRVSRDDAERDIKRRVADFQYGIVKKISAPTWTSLTEEQKAALTSIAYNYGSLPDSVATAVRKGGDVEAAIRKLSAHNNGVNARRRNEEADIFAKGAAKGSTSPVQPRQVSTPKKTPQQLAQGFVGTFFRDPMKDVQEDDPEAKQVAARLRGGSSKPMDVAAVAAKNPKTAAQMAQEFAQNTGQVINQLPGVSQLGDVLGLLGKGLGAVSPINLGNVAIQGIQGKDPIEAYKQGIGAGGQLGKALPGAVINAPLEIVADMGVLMSQDPRTSARDRAGAIANILLQSNILDPMVAFKGVKAIASKIKNVQAAKAIDQAVKQGVSPADVQAAMKQKASFTPKADPSYVSEEVPDLKASVAPKPKQVTQEGSRRVEATQVSAKDTSGSAPTSSQSVGKGDDGRRTPAVERAESEAIAADEGLQKFIKEGEDIESTARRAAEDHSRRVSELHKKMDALRDEGRGRTADVSGMGPIKSKKYLAENERIQTEFNAAKEELAKLESQNISIQGKFETNVRKAIVAHKLGSPRVILNGSPKAVDEMERSLKVHGFETERVDPQLGSDAVAIKSAADSAQAPGIGTQSGKPKPETKTGEAKPDAVPGASGTSGTVKTEVIKTRNGASAEISNPREGTFDVDDRGRQFAVSATLFDENGVTLALHKTVGEGGSKYSGPRSWTVSDPVTGKYIATGESKAGAVLYARQYLAEARESVERALKQGRTPSENTKRFFPDLAAKYKLVDDAPKPPQADPSVSKPKVETPPAKGAKQASSSDTSVSETTSSRNVNQVDGKREIWEKTREDYLRERGGSYDSKTGREEPNVSYHEWNLYREVADTGKRQWQVPLMERLRIAERELYGKNGVLSDDDLLRGIPGAHPHNNYFATVRTDHSAAVSLAKRTGAPVPDSVLKDYPDLAERFADAPKAKPADPIVENPQVKTGESQVQKPKSESKSEGTGKGEVKDVEPSGLSRSSREILSDIYGTNKPVSIGGKSHKELYDDGVKRLDEGYDADKAMRELAEDGKPASAEQIGIFAAHRDRLMGELKRLKELPDSPERNILMERIADFDRNLDEVKGAAGRSLASLKIGHTVNWADLDAVKIEAKRIKGSDLSTGGERAVKEYSDRVAQAEKRIADLEEDLADVKRGGSKPDTEEVIRRARAVRGEKKEVIRKRMDDRWEAFAKSQQVQSGFTFDQLKLLGEQAVDAIRYTGATVDDAIRTIIEEAAKRGFKVTEQDIYDGLDQSKPKRTRSEIENEVAKLRRKARELSSKGQERAKVKAEKKDIKAQDETFKKIHDVQDQIADLQKQLANKEYRVPTKREIVVDAQLKDQRAVRDLYSSKIRQVIENEAKPLASKAAKFVGSNVRGVILGSDIGVLTRQGLFGLSRPGSFLKGLKNAGKAMFSEENLVKIEKEIIEHKVGGRTAALWHKDAGLSLSHSHLGNHEELLVAGLLKKIPVLGKFAGMGERFQSAFINTLRSDMFDRAVKLGYNMDELKARAQFINSVTGRSNMKGEPHELLQLVMTSPRYERSRWETLLSPAKNVGTIAGDLAKGKGLNRGAVANVQDMAVTAAEIYGLFKLAELGGYEVEWDGTSSDFLKMRKGDEVWDVSAGLAPRLRDAIRFIAYGLKPTQYNNAGRVIQGAFTRTISPAVRTPIEAGSQVVQRKMGTPEDKLTSIFTGYKLNPDDKGLIVFAPLIIQTAKKYLDEGDYAGAVGAAGREAIGQSVSRYPKKEPRR